MNSFLKGVLHAIVSAIGIYLPIIISSSPVFQMTIGTVLTIGFNWLVSHYVPTTTGASVKQG